MSKKTQKGKFTRLSFDKKMRGFIVFEGLDGSGLSTQAKLLGDYLKDKGHEVVLTKEPTRDSEAGRRIRTILDEKIKAEPAEIQKLFVQDRKEHLENLIIPALQGGKVVISDRYFFSTIAFGGANLNLEWLINLNKNFLVPDITFFIMVRPEICIERIIKRGDGIKLFEKLEMLRRVYKNYQIVAKRFKNVYLIDGEPAKERVFEDIKKIINNEII